MLVGLVDLDLIKKIDGCYPSIELMKYSSYYKKQKDMVRLCTDLSNIDFYDLIIIRQENPKVNLSPKLLNNPKVKLVGKGFFGKKKVLLPEQIFSCAPDYTLYSDFIERHKEEKWIKRFKRVCGYELMELYGKNCDMIPLLKSTDKNTIALYDDGIINDPKLKRILDFFPDKQILLMGTQKIYGIDELKRIDEEQKFHYETFFYCQLSVEDLFRIEEVGKTKNNYIFLIPDVKYNITFFIKIIEKIYPLLATYAFNTVPNSDNDNLYYRLLCITLRSNPNLRKLNKKDNNEMRKILREYPYLYKYFN